MASDPGEGKTPPGRGGRQVGRRAAVQRPGRGCHRQKARLYVVDGKAGRRRSISANVVDRVTPNMALLWRGELWPVRASSAPVMRSTPSRSPTTRNTASHPPCSRAISPRGSISPSARRPGIAHINGPTVHDEAQMPSAAPRPSDMAASAARRGIEEFTEPRRITIETQAGAFRSGGLPIAAIPALAPGLTGANLRS